MDTFSLEGIVRIYELPEDLWSAEAFQRWWPRFSLAEREKHGRLVVEARNLVTSAGRSLILTYIGNSGTTAAFAQQYAVGTGAIAQVSPSDAALASELFRAAPSSYTVVGNQVTISTIFSTSQANGAWTNCGLFGNGATSTTGSGTLMTHLLCTYTKTSAVSVTSDYYLSLQ